MSKTIDFYNKNAKDYIKQTENILNKDDLDNFILMLPKKSKVLDVGTGSGRDSLYFIENGMEVIAIDASYELAKLASKKIGKEVKVMSVLDLNNEKEFDGIWASASLLHLEKKEFNVALDKLLLALKEDGKLYFSLKVGNGSNIDEKNRYFSYYNENELLGLLKEKGFNEPIIKIDKDKMGRGNDWISIKIENSLRYQNKIEIKNNTMMFLSNNLDKKFYQVNENKDNLSMYLCSNKKKFKNLNKEELNYLIRRTNLKQQNEFGLNLGMILISVANKKIENTDKNIDWDYVIKNSDLKQIDKIDCSILDYAIMEMEINEISSKSWDLLIKNCSYKSNQVRDIKLKQIKNIILQEKTNIILEDKKIDIKQEIKKNNKI